LRRLLCGLIGLRPGALLAERVTLELGPSSKREIRAALEREVESQRWTSLDRALRDILDERGGVADLRPCPGGEDLELRRWLVGRAAKLERLGLADPVLGKGQADFPRRC
jgi:type IV secretory pathway VirD2 relaxase